MYRIIGADDKEYGPVTADQVRQWLREGRLNRTSRIKPDGASEWKVVGALPEFDESFPPLPGMPPKPAGPLENSGMATGALICGATGLLVCVTAPIGLALGIIAHSQIRKSQGRIIGSGRATGGIVISVIAILLWLVAGPVLMFLPALHRAKERAESIRCMNNVRQLALAVRIYANANNDTLPSATNWCADLQQYVGSTTVFQCPKGDQDLENHFAFNAKLSHVTEKNIRQPATTVLIFESPGGWNQFGGPETALATSRHGKGIIVGFADGHVEVVPVSRLQQLNWDP